MTEYRVRAAVFNSRGAVYYPSGHDSGSRRRGFPISAPPRYQPPVERVYRTASLKLARELVRELRLEHGERVAIHVEPIETAPAEPRPRQTSLADDWPRQRRQP